MTRTAIAAALALLALLLPGRAAATPPPLACETPAGFQELYERPQRLIFLAEIHGTEQVPAFLYELICGYLARGERVVLGLEMDHGDQPAIDAFLKDGGRNPDLLFTYWWWNDFQFGVHTSAKLDLLTRVALLQAAGYPVEVHAVVRYERDAPSTDTGRARYIRENFPPARDGIGIVLMGRLHVLWNGNPPDQPTANLSSHFDRDEAIVLHMSHEAGKAWVCYGTRASGCGVWERAALNLVDSPHKGPFIKLDADTVGEDDGVFYVGPITPSPPAFATLRPDG